MAYRRSTRNGYGSRPRRTAVRSRSRGGNTGRRKVTRGRSGQQVVRIVLETAANSPVSRNPFAPVVEAKTGGKAKL